MNWGRHVGAVCGILLGTWLLKAAPTADSALAALKAYDGSWRVTRSDSSKPEALKNQCQTIGKFYACQQTVDGTVTALLVFVPLSQPGHYATQSVNPDGRALGRGELQISGNQWVLTSMWNQGSGRDTYYKTTNVFNGHDHIHFEQQESTNGKDWSTKASGDYTRVAVAR